MNQLPIAYSKVSPLRPGDKRAVWSRQEERRRMRGVRNTGTARLQQRGYFQTIIEISISDDSDHSSINP
jgi:hypothetical protein